MDHTTWVFAAIVGVFSSARITRLDVFDHWPPLVWIRDTWDRATATSGWNLLLHCAYCLGAWVTLGIFLWGYLTDWQTAWWLVNGILGASYATAIVVAYDGDD